jgi:hypothetical protein
MKTSKLIETAYIFNPKLNFANQKAELITGIKSIDDLNLDRLIFKAMDSHSGYGWEIDYSQNISLLYRVFLFLCKTYPNEIIVPPFEIDAFWHLHILDTRNYIIDCENIFGEYLHHFPYAGLAGVEVTEQDEEKFKNRTVELVHLHFPDLAG